MDQKNNHGYDLNDGFPKDFNANKHNIKAHNDGEQQTGSHADYDIELRTIRHKGKHLPVHDCIGQILMKFDVDEDVMSGGSGIVFKKLANDYYVVLTAAHNLLRFNKISKTTKDPINVWYFPRGSVERECRLQFVKETINIYSEYNPQNDLCSGDVAVVLFHDKKGRNGAGSRHYNTVAVNDIIEITQWPEDEDPTVNVFGYPVKSEGRLQGQSGETELEENKGFWIYEDIHTYPGQSGAPIFKKIRKQKKYGIYGVHTFGDTTKQENCGIFLDSQKREWIEQNVVKFKTIAKANALNVVPLQRVKVRLIPSNYPNHYITHSNYELQIVDHENSANDLYWNWNDSTFYMMKPALSGDEDNVSFVAVGSEDFFVRHSGFFCTVPFRLCINKNDNTTLFFNDASFKIVSALNGRDGYVSFESRNCGDRFMRHRDSELWLDTKSSADLYKNDASFKIEYV